jgi:hypothetical protein
MLQTWKNNEINPQMSTNDGLLKWWHVPLEGLPQGIGMTFDTMCYKRLVNLEDVP